jgi:hypothetical protein
LKKLAKWMKKRSCFFFWVFMKLGIFSYFIYCNHLDLFIAFVHFPVVCSYQFIKYVCILWPCFSLQIFFYSIIFLLTLCCLFYSQTIFIL